MTMKKIIALATAALILSSATAMAAPEKYTFDKAHTQVMFSVSHLGYSFSHGNFTEVTGGFSFDQEKVEDSKIDVAIKTGSIDMNDQKWDEHLKNADFFNVEKFPEMTFKSTKIEKTGDNTGKVTGDLTIIGVTKPVTLDVTFNKGGIHPYSKKYYAGFSANGKINRSDFGMNYGLPGVGDEVSINLQVEATRDDGDTAETPAKDEKAETKQ